MRFGPTLPTQHAEALAEGAEYAAAFLVNARAGLASPQALLNLVQFMAGGPMLEGLCSVLQAALAMQPDGLHDTANKNPVT